MSRGKTNPPPLVLTIESLSDGKTVVQPMVDDFTNEVIEPKAVVQAKGEIIDPIEASRRKARDDSALLLAIFMPKRAPKHALQRLEALRKPKPTPRNEHKLGQYVMVLPKRPFRRV